METRQNDVTQLDMVGALARRNNFSVDSFIEITKIKEADFINLVTNLMSRTKNEATTLDQLSRRNLKAEKETAATQAKVNTARERNRKEIIRKQIKLGQKEVQGAFMKSVFRSGSFWFLSVTNTIYIGAWNFVLWGLIRPRKIDLSNIVGGVIEHFAAYANGIPSPDMILILGFGIGFSFLYWAIHILMYQWNHIIKAYKHWMRLETLAGVSLIVLELALAIYLLDRSSQGGLTNKLLSETSLTTIAFESGVFIAFWILYYFLVYKYWIAYIRDTAGKISGETYLLEIREEINKAKRKEADFEKTENKLKETAEGIKQENEILKSRIQAFTTAEYGIAKSALDHKNSIVDFEQKWLLHARDHYNTSGISGSYGDYEVIIRNVVGTIIQAIDSRTKKCMEFIEKCKEYAIRLLAALDGSRVVFSPLTVKFLPIVLLVLSFVTMTACTDYLVHDPKSDVRHLNVIVPIDLSDRFLMDQDTLYLPVEFDLSVIQSSYNAWEQEIISIYDRGIYVADVEGDFWVIPIPTPHESRRAVSAMGFGLELSDLPVLSRWDYLPAQEDSIMRRSRLIYETALRFEPSGADVWAFFRDLDPYLRISDDSMEWQNKLVLLTDGYPYIEKALKSQRNSLGGRRDYLDEADMDKLRIATNWEDKYQKNDMGFLPTGKTYENLEVLVIGLNEPSTYQGSAKELIIIERYWSDFFKSMGILHYKFVRLNSPVADKIIREFIKS